MISMMTIPIPMAITVPAGPATGRKVLPGIANTPQPTIQPKAMLHTSRGDRYRSSAFFSSVMRQVSVSLFHGCFSDRISCKVRMISAIS